MLVRNGGKVMSISTKNLKKLLLTVVEGKEAKPESFGAKDAGDVKHDLSGLDRGKALNMLRDML